MKLRGGWLGQVTVGVGVYIYAFGICNTEALPVSDEVALQLPTVFAVCAVGDSNSTLSGIFIEGGAGGRGGGVTLCNAQLFSQNCEIDWRVHSRG